MVCGFVKQYTYFLITNLLTLCELFICDSSTVLSLYRGYTIPQLREKLPKAPGGEEPLPEGLFWLLLTGSLPTEAQVKAVSRTWAQQADLPSHVVTLLNNLPASVHPMSQLSAAITACNTESKFVKAYNDVCKTAPILRFP